MHEQAGMTVRRPASSVAISSVQGTVLAFDFGLRHIGVAVGETALGVAHPLESIDAESNAARFAAVTRLVETWKPVRLVLGLPLHMDGSEHELTRRVRRFARQLEGRYGLPVALVDERLSSVEAEAQLRAQGRGGRADKALTHSLAAQIILQNYFDDHDAA